MLSAVEVGELRLLLAAERERTDGQIASLRAEFDAIVESVEADAPDDEHDPEGSTRGFERARVAALLADARARLADLDRAAVRLDAGDFGVCVACGQPIPFERLAVQLATDRCVACASGSTGPVWGRLPQV